MHYLDVSLSYFTLGNKFLNLAKSSSLMIVQSGNNFSSDWEDRILSKDELDALTEWSDMNLSVPILFNFYHGIELMIKGLLVIQNGSGTEFGHKFSELLSRLNPKLIGEDLFNKIKSLTSDVVLKENIFSKFLLDNDLDIDRWYEFLKYPFVRGKEDDVNFFNLKYKACKGIDFWKEIAEECELILKMSARLFHQCSRPLILRKITTKNEKISIS